ncbi:DUF5658 family protein [Frigoriglobus tundricola]|uniref:DUF5658 domain-containing protein n=1 Tax=Frigoriglobus tundricola TaxID=2774151 RepID=A0A6M5YHQ9_9BACT|nr:DUF5658 family protein [Frigoriglobus tundricola]QJW92881.1 hypothetical protein FTUN_0378 [Frigoriglobus tundricola]
MCLKLAVWMGLGLYALLSATDWMMTHALLKLHPDAVEANPIAAACLDLHGWDGLALFKVGGVLMFLGAVFLLVRRRPAVAAGVVAIGCSVLLSVTVYTHSLILQAHREAAEEDVAWPKAKVVARNGIEGAAPERCWFAGDEPPPVQRVVVVRPRLVLRKPHPSQPHLPQQ